MLTQACHVHDHLLASYEVDCVEGRIVFREVGSWQERPAPPGTRPFTPARVPTPSQTHPRKPRAATVTVTTRTSDARLSGARAFVVRRCLRPGRSAPIPARRASRCGRDRVVRGWRVVARWRG